jgi:putative ABC transport system permease protein
MLKNYLKIALRNLWKNKLFTLINISGMAISLASVLIIALFINDEMRYDKHVEDVSMKYRLYSDYFYGDGRRGKLAMVPPMIAPTLMTEYPEVEYYTRFMNFNSKVLFEVGEKKMTEGKGGYADSTIFDMFSLKLVEGDARTALSEPNAIAISQTLARKYFGNKPALDQTISVDNGDMVVKAVFEDFSPYSHLQLNFMLAMDGLINAIPERMKSWGWSQFHSYIKLRPDANPEAFSAKLKSFDEKYAWPTTRNNGGGYYITYVMPMADIHLKASDQLYDIAVRGNALTVYVLSATAVFILIIAILNFINLSTARAVSRVKEVGVRKVVGALRTQLIYQFISESVIIALMALLIGGFITELVLPALNSFTEKTIPAGIFLNPLLLVVVVVFAILVGTAAGAYPAFYISGYRPAEILSNKKGGRSGKTLLRKGLVVLQFMLSFFLISASLIVSDQLNYMRTKDIGFQKDNLIVLPIRGEIERNLEAAKNAFLNHPNIINASFGYGLPGEAFASDGVIDKVANKEMGITMLPVDHDYVKTLGLTIVAGRDFSKDIVTDTANAFIISERAAKMFGYSDPEQALGHELAWPRWDDPSKRKEGRVIGIVKDMHMNSLRENLSPIMMHVYPFGYATLSLRVKPENLPETISHLEATWKKFNSEWPFEYRFLDANFDKMYKSEEKLATLFTFFTGFTIFVACLGLFGLVVYTTSQRYKEISIRKVLGAEEMSLVMQLGRNYVLLITIAFFIAIPFSYYAANEWLAKFAYRITITPMLFIKAGLFILVISLLTVGIQSFKAARANPVDALKEQ